MMRVFIACFDRATLHGRPTGLSPFRRGDFSRDGVVVSTAGYYPPDASSILAPAMRGRRGKLPRFSVKHTNKGRVCAAFIRFYDFSLNFSLKSLTVL